ncbi:hypothetical protein BDR05DRAFT_784994 [Suillus weaverae]|nr:hypothetical protein BDR05DRAFT_784994 [Suillus weaverae]
MTTPVMTQAATRSPSTIRSTPKAQVPSSSTARLSVVSSTAVPARSPSTTPRRSTAATTTRPTAATTTRPTATPTTRSAAAPPPSTYPIPLRQNTQPLQLNLNRSTSIELSAAPIRKGPLIFAAMAINQDQITSMQENISPSQNTNPSIGQGPIPNVSSSTHQRASIIQHDNSVNATCISASSARRDHQMPGYPSPPAECTSLDLGAGKGLNVPLGVPVPSNTERASVHLASVPYTSERGLVRGGSERIPVSSTSAQGQGQGQRQARLIASGPSATSRDPLAFETGAGMRISLDVGSGRSSDAPTARSHDVGRSSDVGPPPSRLRVSSDASVRLPPPTVRKLSRATSKESLKPRVLTKSRPPTPSSTSPSSVPSRLLTKLSMEALFSEDTLFLDEDPFKKVEGVQVVKGCGSEEGGVTSRL